MLKNPVVRIREELGLSRKELAHATGIRYDGLYLVEAGLIARPHRRLLEFLEGLGYDPKDVTREYLLYRQALHENVLRKFSN